mgnify:FL=1
MNIQVSQQLEVANTHLTQGDFEQAAFLFQDIVHRSPTLVGARAGLSKALLKLDRGKEAIEHLLKALEYSPEDADISYNLGVAYHQQGNYSSAIECYENAHESDADSPDDLHYNLGNAYHELERFYDAIRCYNKALASKPNDIDALKNLAIAYQRLGRNEEARACYKKLEKLRKN